ncbi:MAG: septum site-determining protein MinC, partial [Lacisediminimonas sp.]|nr:septum site-determining protein MinC [Lacisediminimonas sp.]
SADLTLASQSLSHITGGQQDYFDNELTVVELALDDADAIDWPGLLALLRQWGLNPVAVRNAPVALQPSLRELGLSLEEVSARSPAAPDASVPDHQAVQAQYEASAAPEIATSAAAQTPARACMMIDTPVRGGQRIYARGADLVVTAVVNAGAELIADGSIHVYAPLRGRALAGASGDVNARIFTLSMEAELVSIAGIYRTFEDGQHKEVARRPAEVRLAGDRLETRAISSERRS